jgi:hypothetical protein
MLGIGPRAASKTGSPFALSEAAKGRRVWPFGVPRRPAWWWIGIYAAVNVPLIVWTLYVNLVVHPIPPDWWIFSALPDRLRDGNLYAVDGYFRWSPVAAWVVAAIVPIGLAGWVALHAAVLVLVRDTRMVLLILLSWGFWMDVSTGNLFALVFIAGLLALRGSRVATVTYFALCLLMPRPIQLPLLAWLLWDRPAMRLPFVGVALVHTALVMLSGYGDDWIAVLISTSSSESSLPFPLNSAPSAFVGPALWLVAAAPLAVWLFVRGRVGWASLLLSPYWLAQYWMMPLLELAGRSTSGQVTDPDSRAAPVPGSPSATHVRR